MLIIFDLDDTLIDTSGSILPSLLKNILTALIEKLKLDINFDKAYSNLMQLNAFHESSSDVWLEFLELYQFPEESFQFVADQMSSKSLFNQPIRCVDGAFDMLKSLSQKHSLALVSQGVDSIQKEKLKYAQLPIKLFSGVEFCLPGKKYESYQRISHQLGVPSSRIVVCGDRISRDLSPAKQLGCFTIHMRWGRGLGNTGLKSDVDDTILSLRELERVILKISTKGL